MKALPQYVENVLAFVGEKEYKYLGTDPKVATDRLRKELIEESLTAKNPAPRDPNKEIVAKVKLNPTKPVKTMMGTFRMCEGCAKKWRDWKGEDDPYWDEPCPEHEYMDGGCECEQAIHFEKGEASTPRQEAKAWSKADKKEKIESIVKRMDAGDRVRVSKADATDIFAHLYSVKPPRGDEAVIWEDEPGFVRLFFKGKPLEKSGLLGAKNPMSKILSDEETNEVIKLMWKQEYKDRNFVSDEIMAYLGPRHNGFKGWSDLRIDTLMDDLKRVYEHVGRKKGWPGFKGTGMIGLGKKNPWPQDNQIPSDFKPNFKNWLDWRKNDSFCLNTKAKFEDHPDVEETICVMDGRMSFVYPFTHQGPRGCPDTDHDWIHLSVEKNVLHHADDEKKIINDPYGGGELIITNWRAIMRELIEKGMAQEGYVMKSNPTPGTDSGKAETPETGKPPAALMRAIAKCAQNPRRSEGMKPSDFDQTQLKIGREHEAEHTDSPDEAMKIAMDHLAEDPDYYKKLAKMEAGACNPSAKTNPRPRVQKELSAFGKAFMDSNLGEKARALSGAKREEAIKNMEHIYREIEILADKFSDLILSTVFGLKVKRTKNDPEPTALEDRPGMSELQQRERIMNRYLKLDIQMWVITLLVKIADFSKEELDRVTDALEGRKTLKELQGRGNRLANATVMFNLIGSAMLDKVDPKHLLMAIQNPENKKKIASIYKHKAEEAKKLAVREGKKGAEIKQKEISEAKLEIEFTPDMLKRLGVDQALSEREKAARAEILGGIDPTILAQASSQAMSEGHKRLEQLSKGLKDPKQPLGLPSLDMKIIMEIMSKHPETKALYDEALLKRVELEKKKKKKGRK